MCVCGKNMANTDLLLRLKLSETEMSLHLLYSESTTLLVLRPFVALIHGEVLL